MSNSNYGFQPTLDGLNNIDSNSINTDNLEVDTLTILNSGTAPTVVSTSNDNSIATTAFVQSHTSGNYVTLTTNQTITGQKTFTNQTYIDYFNGKYIDLKAGQFRMFSSPSGGSAIYFYVPPSGRSIMDFSTTNCDMVGQYNMTSNNITCSIAPTSSNEYTNKNYVDTNFVDLTTTQTISGVKSINSYLKFTNTFNGQYGSIGYNALNSWLSLSSTNNFNINAGGNTTYSNGGGIFNIKSNTLGVNTILNLNDNYDNTLFKFDCSGTANTIYSYYPLTINATNPTFTSNARCSVAPTNSNDYCNKSYVDSAISGGLTNYVTTNTTQTITGAKTFNGITTFDNNVINNFFVNNLDVVSFQNGAYFDNVCPYSTVAPTGSNDLTQKSYVDNNFVGLTNTQTISGAKTFNNFAVNQTTGDVNITLNNSTQKVNIVRGTNTINFSTNAGPALNSSSTTTPFIISAGSGTTSAGFNLNPTGGLGEGGEMIIGSTAYCGKNLWIDGTNGGLKSFGSNNIRIYNPFAYSYNPSTITWGSPSPNTINGWTNSPTNDGQTYSGTASDSSTPANVGQIVLPAPGIWFLQVSALITLNTGSDTITDRTIVVSDVGTTDSTPCTVGFAYRDPIDDGAGSAGNRQIVNFSGIYHFVDASSGTRTLYINAIVVTSGTRTVTVSGNYKYTRIG